MTVTYPIVALVDGAVLDPAWISDVTAAANDHQTRLSSLETSFNPQVSYTTNGTMATGTGTEVAMTAWTGGASPTHVFKSGWVHELSIQGAVADSNAGTAPLRCNVRVRKGLNTIVGQQLALIYALSMGASSTVISCSAIRYIKNATAVDISTQLGMTIQRGTGAGNSLLYGDADVPLMVTMRPIGLISQLTNFAAIAISIV